MIFYFILQTPTQHELIYVMRNRSFHFYYQSETTLGPGGPGFPGMPYKKGKKNNPQVKKSQSSALI